jgi:lambda family phage portal protein
MSEPKPTFIDRAIETVAPAWAVRRAMARQVLASHRGGIPTRTDRPWQQSQSYIGGKAADRANQASRRDRGRKVYKENAIGRSLLKTEVDNVVSCGFRLQCKALGSDGKAALDFNREVEARWDEWLEVADIRGILSGVDLIRQFYKSPRRDGDGGIVLVDQGGNSKLQYIPGDLISTPYSGYGASLKNNATTIIDGIEVDATTRPKAFHVLSQDELGKRDWSRVPANNFIYLAPEIDDDLGLRGDPCYSTIFGYLDQIDGYVDALVIAARMGCVFGLIFKEETAATQFNQLSALTNSQGRQQKAVTLENGSLKYIGQKDDVVQVQAQQPMQQAPDFIRAMCRFLGLPFDMPLELVLKDLSQTNFSSARIGLIGYYRACRARQKAFIARCMSRIFRWWLSREIKLGRIIAPIPQDPLAHKFVSEGWDYTNPVSEAQADQLQIDMGIKTPQMAAAERGRDYEEMVIDNAAAGALRKLNKLPEIAGNYTRDRIEVTEKPAGQPTGEQDGESNQEDE